MSIEVGDRLGRWTVIRRAEAGFIGSQRRGRWVVRCACRHTATVFAHDLSRGRSSGCSPSTNQLPRLAAACREMWSRAHVVGAASSAVRRVLEAEDIEEHVIARVENALEDLAARKASPGRGEGPTGGTTVKA